MSTDNHLFCVVTIVQTDIHWEMSDFTKRFAIWKLQILIMIFPFHLKINLQKVVKFSECIILE